MTRSFLESPVEGLYPLGQLIGETGTIPRFANTWDMLRPGSKVVRFELPIADPT